MAKSTVRLIENYTNGVAPSGGQPAGYPFGGAFNGAATFRTAPLDVSVLTWVGYAVRTGGTATGAWSIQYSNDFVPGVDDPTSDAKWDTHTLTTTPPAAVGAGQTFGIVIDDYEFKYIRIKFTSTGGTMSSIFVASQLKGT